MLARHLTHLGYIKRGVRFEPSTTGGWDSHTDIEREHKRLFEVVVDQDRPQNHPAFPPRPLIRADRSRQWSIGRSRLSCSIRSPKPFGRTPVLNHRALRQNGMASQDITRMGSCRTWMSQHGLERSIFLTSPNIGPSNEGNDLFVTENPVHVPRSASHGISLSSFPGMNDHHSLLVYKGLRSRVLHFGWSTTFLIDIINVHGNCLIKKIFE